LNEFARRLSAAFASGLALALPVAEMGDAKAQCLVSGLYLNGLGTQIDSQAAVGWLRKAGEQGCALAWHNLSNLYLVGGVGIEINKEEALVCRQRAIQHGFDVRVELPKSWTKCYEDLFR
jgi:TPR repeat protein